MNYRTRGWAFRRLPGEPVWTGRPYASNFVRDCNPPGTVRGSQDHGCWIPLSITCANGSPPIRDCPEAVFGESRARGGGLHKLEPKELGNAPADAIFELLPEAERPMRTKQLEFCWAAERFYLDADWIWDKLRLPLQECCLVCNIPSKRSAGHQP